MWQPTVASVGWVGDGPCGPVWRQHVKRASTLAGVAMIFRWQQVLLASFGKASLAALMAHDMVGCAG